jgi:hypothetical protein
MENRDLGILLSMWLGVPLTAADFWLAWGSLPDKVPMKKGAAGQVLAWTTRAEALTFDLKLLAGVLLFVTLIGWLIGLSAPEKGTLAALVLALAGWGMVILLNWVLWSIQVG